MAGDMARLVALLARKGEVMEEMVRSLGEEQEGIIAMNPGAVTASCRKREEIAARLAPLTDECREVMALAGAERGLSGSITLSRLIESATDTERNDLLPLQQRLVRLGGSLQRQQELNRRLLAQSLGVIERSVSLLSRLLGGCDTYGVHGRVSTGIAGVNILSREI